MSEIARDRVKGLALKLSDDSELRSSQRVLLTEKTLPKLEKGQVLVKMLAAPVNPSDLVYLLGKYGLAPNNGAFVGFEGCGIIVDANAGVYGRWLKGKRVALSAQPGSDGVWAEYAITKANFCLPVRKELSDEQDQSGQQQNKEGEQNQSGDERFTEQEQAKIEELKERDREVVTHELAHANAGGQYAGSPSYTYETGPDGVKYAVAGEVPIDTSKVAGDPQATIAKAAQIKRAALAPAEPSGQDRKVAAQADRMAAEARQEVLKEAGPAGSENDEEQSDYRVNNVVESDAFNERATLAQDEEFQQTIVNRSLHINAFYQQSSQASNNQFHSQA